MINLNKYISKITIMQNKRFSPLILGRFTSSCRLHPMNIIMKHASNSIVMWMLCVQHIERKVTGVSLGRHLQFQLSWGSFLQPVPPHSEWHELSRHIAKSAASCLSEFSKLYFYFDFTSRKMAHLPTTPQRWDSSLIQVFQCAGSDVVVQTRYSFLSICLIQLLILACTRISISYSFAWFLRKLQV